MPKEPLRRVLERHSQRIVSLPGVVGVAQGEAGGGPCITVYVVEKTPEVMSRIPSDLDGWPIVVRKSGRFRTT